jgi:hypothetical protein
VRPVSLKLGSGSTRVRASTCCTCVARDVLPIRLSPCQRSLQTLLSLLLLLLLLLLPLALVLQQLQRRLLHDRHSRQLPVRERTA